jgi:hypothetical protein
MKNSPFTFLEMKSEALERLRYAKLINPVDAESFTSIRDAKTPVELSLRINEAIIGNGIVGIERADLTNIRKFLKEL